MQNTYSRDIDINIWRILVATNPTQVNKNGDIRIFKVNQHCTVTCVETYATIFATSADVANTVIDMAIMMENYTDRMVKSVVDFY